MSQLVSVIIPCFNTASMVGETLDSVLSQTYQNLEIIIVNDGSTDDLEETIKPYLKNKNIRYLVQDNGGVSNARNNGAHFAKGEYFVFLDSDDMIVSSYIEKCVSVLNENPNVKVVYSNGWNFGAADGKYKYPKYRFRLLLLENIIAPRALIRKDDFFNAGMYDESMRGSEDWDFWISMLENGGDVVLLPEFLFYYRRRPDKSSLTDFMAENPVVEREYQQKIYENHKTAYLKEFGTEVDMIRLIASQNRIIERYERKKRKSYRRFLRF